MYSLNFEGRAEDVEGPQVRRQMVRAIANTGVEPEGEDEDLAEQQLIKEARYSPQIVATSSDLAAHTEQPPVLVSMSPPGRSLSPVSPAQDMIKISPTQLSIPRDVFVKVPPLEQVSKDRHGQKPSLKRCLRIKAPVFVPSQEEPVPIDTREMARLNRRNFARQVTAEVGGSLIPNTSIQPRMTEQEPPVDIDTSEPPEALRRIGFPVLEDQGAEDLQTDPEHGHCASQPASPPTTQDRSRSLNHSPPDTMNSGKISIPDTVSLDNQPPVNDEVSEIESYATAYGRFRTELPFLPRK